MAGSGDRRTRAARVASAIAELDSNFISERIKAGLEVAKNEGVMLGRKIDTRKRARLLRWDERGVRVKDQAEELGVSTAAV